MTTAHFLKKPPCVLSIAGSDTSGGAGIQADIKTISACGAYALTAITAITAQNSHGVQGSWPVSAVQLQQQILCSVSAQPVAIKVGMLANAELVDVLVAILQQHKDIPVILDPVLIASSGTHLLDDAGINHLRDDLLPLATLITPNIYEARVLFGTNFMPAAHAWAQQTGVAVLITGGDKVAGYNDHEKNCSDIFIHGKHQEILSSPRIKTSNNHGAGCTLSSAIASFIAQKQALISAIQNARGYVYGALLAVQSDTQTNAGALHHFHAFSTPNFQQNTPINSF